MYFTLESSTVFQMLSVYMVCIPYDEACFMHLTPGVVHDFPKAMGV